MKIAFLINSLSTGGAEKLVTDLLPEFYKNGLNVDLILLNGEETPFLNKLKKNSFIKIITLGKNSVYNPIHIFRLIPLVNKYDLIHVHLFPSSYFVIIAKWLSFSKTKIVFTEHSTNNKRIKRGGFFKLLDKIIYKGFDVVIALNDDVKQIIKTHIGEKLNIKVIHNGINLDYYFRAKAHRKEDFLFKNTDIFLIQVSSFREAKDQNTVIRSLKFLPENIKLILVGEGHLKSESLELSQKLGVENRVLLLGQRNDIPELIKMCDISILSSKWEGFGLFAVESMACKKPVICSNVIGMRSVVKNAALLFEVGNSLELSEKIMSLVQNKDIYNKMKTLAYTRAKEFDLKLMIKKHLELYKTLAK